MSNRQTQRTAYKVLFVVGNPNNTADILLLIMRANHISQTYLRRMEGTMIKALGNYSSGEALLHNP